MVNTVEKFLKVSGFDRGNNYPCVTSLKLEMSKHDINEDLKIDVMSYFLYDNKSK